MRSIGPKIGWLLVGVAAGVAILVAELTLTFLLSLEGSAAKLLLGPAIVVIACGVVGLVPTASRNVARVMRSVFVTAGMVVFVCVVYLVVVVGLDRQANPDERPIVVLSLVAAIVVVLLAVPVRGRIRDVALRIAPERAAKPQDALDALSARMTRSVPMDELLLQLAENLKASMAPAGAEVWTADEAGFTRRVSVPNASERTLSLDPEEQKLIARARVSGNAWAAIWIPNLLAERPDVVLRIAPISHLGELLGFLVAARPAASGGFAESDDDVLAELARRTGLALHNVRLDSALQASVKELRERNAELQASRSRIISAADESRRRIERDLHDGAQQHLVALAVRLGLARSLVDEDPEQLVPILDDLRRDVQATLAELRSLAHGIYPPLLRDRGLAEALRNAATRATLPVSVEVYVDERLASDVEAAIYFCCVESMTNAGKYAGEDAQVSVTVTRKQDHLEFTVCDDGAGFDPTSTAESQGFVNMRDRVGAIGGSLQVTSSCGQGATVRGDIPVPQVSTGLSSSEAAPVATVQHTS